MNALNKIQSDIKALLPFLKNKYSVKDIGIFGSYTRDEQDPESDLDIIVSFIESPSLFKFIELENFLSDNLNVKVDLVMKTALKQNIKDHILNEVVPI